MATITVRALSDQTKARLRLRAARNGRSTEAEVRAILDAAVGTDGDDVGLGTQFAQMFADVDASALEVPSRTEEPRAAELM